MIAPRQRAFLKAYTVTGSIVKAAEATKIQRGMHYRWLEGKEYADAFAAARLEFADILEAAVMQRALEGVLEPVFYKGKAVGAIRRYSDGNAQFLLRGLRPDVYRERVSAEITGKDGGPIETKPALPEWLTERLKPNPGPGGTTPSPASGDSTPTS